ncbi:hypothetical protein DSM104635_00936 [Terricaulis silvestris]|uniref:Uncharacterized protein n=1 Tax=Terricaulis silvestris TaxID=2686094 RepID=A0A6I6MH51_9CAUL|nr:hypothetical protein DSM104635_00936 [Terricaulis silvestris]
MVQRFELYNGSREAVIATLTYDRTIDVPSGRARTFKIGAPRDTDTLHIRTTHCRYAYRLRPAMTDYPRTPVPVLVPMQLNTDFVLYAFPQRTTLPIDETQLEQRAVFVVRPESVCD